MIACLPAGRGDWENDRISSEDRKHSRGKRERARDTEHVSRLLSQRFWLFVVSIEPIVQRTWQVR